MLDARGDSPKASQDDAADALARLVEDEPSGEAAPPPPPACSDDEPPPPPSAEPRPPMVRPRPKTEAIWRKFAVPPMAVMAAIMFLLGIWAILALLGHNLLTGEPDEAVDRLAKVMLLCWPVGISMVAGVWFFRRQGG